MSDIANAEIHRLQQENTRLRWGLKEARDELARWGWGDMHYGSNMPQEKSVVDTLAKIDQALAGEGEVTDPNE